jgi:hypothetical protein
MGARSRTRLIVLAKLGVVLVAAVVGVMIYLAWPMSLEGVRGSLYRGMPVSELHDLFAKSKLTVERQKPIGYRVLDGERELLIAVEHGKVTTWGIGPVALTEEEKRPGKERLDERGEAATIILVGCAVAGIWAAVLLLPRLLVWFRHAVDKPRTQNSAHRQYKHFVSKATKPPPNQTPPPEPTAGDSTPETGEIAAENPVTFESPQEDGHDTHTSGERSAA